MDDPRIDLRTAAERLGVHYQTAYKWVRSGRLAADRVGTRYLLDPAAVAAFAEARARPRPRRARRPRGGFAGLAARMFDALVAGDERTARAVAVGLIDDGVPVTTVCEEVFVPALARIGAEWHDGKLPIWVEHRAAAIVAQLLGEHHPRPRGRRRGTAMVAAPAGDQHGLPTVMAAAALREDNWRVHHLGADIPGEEVVRFCREHPVDVAVLTVTNGSVRPSAERTASALEAEGVRALVGRPGATLTELQALARSG